MTVYMWCVCYGPTYGYRMFYHCIIMDLESVNKHLFIISLYTYGGMGTGVMLKSPTCIHRHHDIRYHFSHTL